MGLSGAGNTVTNRGTIRADNAAAIWVTANTAGANTIDNYGTIETVLNGGYANAIGSTRNNNATGAGVTVRNHANGRIVGNVKFEAGDDSVILDGGSTHHRILERWQRQQQPDAESRRRHRWARAIRNFGTITKQEAGTWTLNGQVGRNDNNLKSTVKVEGGTLALRGDNSGATQGGVLRR